MNRRKRMKKISAIILSAALILVLTACGGIDLGGGSSNKPPKGMETEPAELFEYEFDAEHGGIKLLKYSGMKTSLKIPDEIEGVPVVGIESACFAVGQVTEVFFNDTVKYFKWGSKYNRATGAENMETIIIPNGVTEIAERTFDDFNSLTSVIIPSSVTTIGRNAFGWCCCNSPSMLTKITIPDNVTSIGPEAFLSKNLASVTIGSGIKDLEGTGLYGINGRAEIIVSENNSAYSSVDGVLFDKNKTTLISYPALKQQDSYIIPDSVTTIYNRAFAYSGLTSIIIPDNITTLGRCAFEGCKRLTNVTIGNGVTIIDYSTFKDCSELMNVTIGNSVTTIDNSAFENTRSLKNLTMPDSLTSIDDYAFQGWSGLTSITYKGKTYNWSDGLEKSEFRNAVNGR